MTDIPKQDGQTIAGILNELMEYSFRYGKGEIPMSENPPLLLARQAEQAIEAYCEARCLERERLARIDELSHVQLEHGHYLTQTFSNDQSMTIEERIAELQQQSSSKGENDD